MSTEYSSRLIYGYKLNPEEADKIFNYLQETSDYTAELCDTYFHPILGWCNKGAIFGIEIARVDEARAIPITSLTPNSADATNLSWAWTLNTDCHNIVPEAEKAMYLCSFVY